MKISTLISAMSDIDDDSPTWEPMRPRTIRRFRSNRGEV